MTYGYPDPHARLRDGLQKLSIIVFLAGLSVLGYLLMRYAGNREGRRAVTLLTLNSTADLYRQVHDRTGRAPASMGEFLQACRADAELSKLLEQFPKPLVKSDAILDSFGHPIRMEQPSPAAASAPGVAAATSPAPLPVFRSAGPDGRFDTYDDIINTPPTTRAAAPAATSTAPR